MLFVLGLKEHPKPFANARPDIQEHKEEQLNHFRGLKLGGFVGVFIVEAADHRSEKVLLGGIWLSVVQLPRCLLYTSDAADE